MKSNRTASFLRPQKMSEQAANKHLTQPSWLLNIYYEARHHIHACLMGFAELTHVPLGSLMTIFVIAIAIAFPASLYVLLRNLTSITQQWSQPPTLSLYLRNQVPAERVSNLLQVLRQREEVQSVNYISPEEGLHQFLAQTKLANVLQALPANPLPGVIVVTPKSRYQNKEALAHLLTDVKALDDVEASRLDMMWVQRLHNFVVLGERITYGLGVLLCISVVLIVGNTIRLATENRRQEIVVMQLIGATNHYIRRPFLYRGAFYGIFGGFVAWLIILLLLTYLSGPAQQLVPNYAQSLWTLKSNLNLALSMMVLSAVLSLAGSWLVVNRFLNEKIMENLI